MIELQTAWGWQPALYLFLGGVGGGAFAFAAILHCFDRKNTERTVCVSMWVALVCLGVGLLCLLTELTAPLRGLMMWQSFSHLTSWMAIGAWILFAAAFVFFAAACLATINLVRAKKGEESLGGASFTVLVVVGAVLGVGVAVYTGILLMSAQGVGFWHTPLLVALFSVSAFDTGIAAVELIHFGQSAHERMSDAVHSKMNKAVIGLVVVESVVLVALFGGALAQGDSTSSAAAYSASAILTGQFSPWFWILVAGLGLLLPLVAALAQIKHGLDVRFDAGDTAETSDCLQGRVEGSSAAPLAIAGALGALIGGCALRFIVVYAGAHSGVVGATMDQIFNSMLL